MSSCSAYKINQWRNGYWERINLHWKKRFLWQEHLKLWRSSQSDGHKGAKCWKSICEWTSSVRESDWRQTKAKSITSTETRRRLEKKKSVLFVVLLTCGDLALHLEKCVIIARKKIISQVFAKRECGILAGKLCTLWLNRGAVIMTLIYLVLQKLRPRKLRPKTHQVVFVVT